MKPNKILPETENPICLGLAVRFFCKILYVVSEKIAKITSKLSVLSPVSHNEGNRKLQL